MSIVVHLVLLLVLVVIPLASDVIAPIPLIVTPSWVFAEPLPPPPAVLVRAASAPSPVSPSAGAPTEMPDKIAPEPPVSQPFVPLGAVEGGLPPGFGIEGGLPPVMAAPPSPPPAPVPQALVRAAQLPELPRKIVDVRPVYPEIARSARVEGTVVLEAVLDTSGRITQLRVLRSVALLDQSAIDAVRQWRYTPSTYNGRAVSVLMTITVHFSLQQ